MRGPRTIADVVGGSPRLRHTGALVIYAGMFSALLVPKLLPVRPGRILSNSPADGAILLWSLGWWPNALSHGHALPYTTSVFAPGGTNLAWTTSIPLPGLLMWPVTRTLGVFAAFNVLSLLAAVTAAWTTYLLVHRLTRAWWSALAAGLAFALSPLERSELAIGHVNLALTALVPLAAYLVVRRVEGTVSAATFFALLGLVLAAEFGISTENFATTALFGGLALAFVSIWDRSVRPVVRRCAVLVASSYALAGALVSPILFTAFAKPHPPALGQSLSPFSGVGTTIGGSGAGRGSGASLSPGHDPAVVVLLLVPLLAICADLAWARRRDPVVRALLATAIAALICSVGVLVVGSTTVPTPWALVNRVPLLRLVRPQRLSMFAWLIAAVGLGVWMAERRTRLRWAGALAVGLMLVPMWWGSWTSVIPPRPWSGDRPPGVGVGSNLAVVAGPGSGTARLQDLAYPTVWQVQSHFSFRLADAYVGSFAPTLPAAVHRFVSGQQLSSGQAAEVLRWLRRAGVSAVMVVRPSPALIGAIASLTGSRPERMDDSVLFPVSPAPG